jgi:hydroxypyruvate reductase
MVTRGRAPQLDAFAREPVVPSELVVLDNMVLLPHLGSVAHETRKAMGESVIAALVRHFSGAA